MKNKKFKKPRIYQYDDGDASFAILATKQKDGYLSGTLIETNNIAQWNVGHHSKHWIKELFFRRKNAVVILDATQFEKSA